MNSVQFELAEETETHVVVSWRLWCGGREREEPGASGPPLLLLLLLLCLRVSVRLVEPTSKEFKWAEARHLSFS